MDTCSIDKSLALARFLANNIVQIRGLCLNVFLEAKEKECLETFNRVMIYVDASYKKTVVDVDCVLILLKSVDEALKGLSYDDRVVYQAYFDTTKEFIEKQFSDSFFSYKEV